MQRELVSPVLRYGVLSPLCFSSEKMRDLFFTGASKTDAAHLQMCEVCMRRVRDRVVARQFRFTPDSLESSTFWNRARRLIGWCETNRYTSLLLGAPNAEVKVAGDMKIVLDVLAPDNFLERVDPVSLRLSGAVRSTTLYSIDESRNGHVVFHHCAVAPHIQQTLASHRLASDTIYLTGRYNGISSSLFFGQLTFSFC